jgi:hypothetical protein
VLAALARKYRALSALRARKDAGDDSATRAELRVLAAEFPGCLRELDVLGATELARRAQACEQAAGAAATARREPWMAWIAEYHALMRAALAVRAGRADAAIDPAFAAAVRDPPDGRLSVLVLRTLAARFDVPADTITAALFPARRSPSPPPAGRRSG